MTTIDEIARFLGAKPRRATPGPGPERIRGPAPLGEATPEHVSFLGYTAPRPLLLLRGARVGLLIVDRGLMAAVDGVLSQGGAAVTAVVPSDNARLDFLRVLRRFFAPPAPRGIHPSAVVDPSAQVAEDVYLGPLCTVGRDVKIGRGSVIHAGVHLYDGVQIGAGVTIHAGSVIGADGFGYERNAAGELEKFPHLGTVIIEDGVEIGANTCVDRGSLGATRIAAGARIDNLVHLAHNTVVGQNAAVIAHAMVGGSTKIGDGAWIAPSACLRDRIRIGRGAVVGLASLVTRDVPDGATVMGAPARDQAAHKRLLGALTQLAEPPPQDPEP